MTSRTIEAVYEGGVFRPTRPVAGLVDRARVRLILEPLGEDEIEHLLATAFESCDGLSSEELAALENARFDQERFFDRGR